MSKRRVDMDRLQELVRLHRMGTGAREVARMLAMSPNTEREYRLALADEGLLAGPADDVPLLEVLRAAVEKRLPTATPPQMVSTVDTVRASIVALAEKGLKAQAIYDRLRLEDKTFAASYWAVRAAWRKWRKGLGVRAEDVAIPVETAPAEVAQVDFGYVGKLYDAASGQLRKAWVFVMVLGYSRRMVVRICFDQKIETWLRVHVEAFAELGGAPATIVPDNLKAAVVRAAFGVDGAASLNRSYRELARHYGIKIDPAPIYAPKKKGKVESGVKYVKGNFFVGRDGNDADDTKRELQRWVDEIANKRTHGTTHRQPIEHFTADEREALCALPERKYELVVWHKARVHQDSHVAFDKRLYSVPWRLIKQEVWLRASPSSITIYADDARVALHDRRGRTSRSTNDEHLPTERAPWRHRHRAYWEDRADKIAPEVGAYIREVFDSDDVLSMLRPVQAIVAHLEKFPVERAVATCTRAAHHGSYQYRTIKNILRDGLDLKPLVKPTCAPLAAPRFARPIGELLHRTEATREHN
jgi:transposase